MTKKVILNLGTVGMLALAGCQSGMYSSDVSVERNNSGVSDYTVVNSLDIQEYPQSMPVVVESKSTNKKGDHEWNNLFWFFTLGVVPGITSEETIYEITVKTPIGEKSGTCKVEASYWMGWLPIFIPYPGIAEERTASPKLPNAAIEGKVCDKLIANLVSQFPKNEYAGFVAKNNTPEVKAQRAKEVAERERLAKERAEAEKARLAKEASERAEKLRLAMHSELYEKTVERDLAQIRKCYSKGEQYQNPFLEKRGRWRDMDDRRRDRNNRRRDGDAKSDWLTKWTSPRLDISESDALAGEALLSEFGTKYMPNAYANFEKKKDVATEIQQVFNEEFAQPWTIKKTSPKWDSFNKVLEKLVKARTEYFICHDELCYYWMGLKLGAISAQELTKTDSQKLSVHLLPENVSRVSYTVMEPKVLDPNVAEFAAKHAPESSSYYQRFEHEQKENKALLDEAFKQQTMMDYVRFDRSLAAAVQKNNDLVRQMTALSLQLQTWYMDHRTMEKSSADVDQCDHAFATKIKAFSESLPSYICVHAMGPIIPAEDMVSIPSGELTVEEEKRDRDGRLKKVSTTYKSSEKMMRFEVTQLQWMFVMGNNPSLYMGPDIPVQNVSWNDCQEFIRRVNDIYGSKYRLPTEHEWTYACKAGGKGEVGKRANGEEGPLSAMGLYDGNNKGCAPTSVGMFEPNAWGLYDMHGNVSEWCANEYYTHDGSSSYKTCKGGDWDCSAGACAASARWPVEVDLKDFRREDRIVARSRLGFRLAE